MTVTPLLSQKTVAMNFSAANSLLHFLHPWECHVAPLHSLPLGFGFELVDPGFFPCDKLQQEVLTSCIMLVQKVSGLFSLPLCVHLLALVAVIDHRS